MQPQISAIQIAEIFKPLFLGELSKYRVLCYYGGRGGGKTEAITRFLVIEALKSPINIAVAREFKGYNDISLKQTFKRVAKDILGTSISVSDVMRFSNGSQIFFVGASINTIDNIRSIDNIKYFWLEEAHNIKDEVLQVLIPSVRGADSQVIISLNPRSKDDYIYKTYILNNEPSYSIAIKVNYSDNPMFPDVLNRDRLRDYETLPRDIYNHIWEGYTNDYNDLAVINTDLIGYYDNDKKQDYRFIVISIDTATSTKNGADYSAIGVFGLITDYSEVHLIHMNRGRYDFHTLNNEIIKTYELAKQLSGASANLILIEAKANGISVIQELQRNTHLRVKGITPMADKVSRVVNDFLPFISKLKIPMHASIYNYWIEDYIRECKLFRADNTHAHDDMIDSTSQALAFLCRKTFNFDSIKEAFQNVKRVL